MCDIVSKGLEPDHWSAGPAGGSHKGEAGNPRKGKVKRSNRKHLHSSLWEPAHYLSTSLWLYLSLSQSIADYYDHEYSVSMVVFSWKLQTQSTCKWYKSVEIHSQIGNRSFTSYTARPRVSKPLQWKKTLIFICQHNLATSVSQLACVFRIIWFENTKTLKKKWQFETNAMRCVSFSETQLLKK